MATKARIYIGFDPREAQAFAVARHSIARRMLRMRAPIHGLVLSKLQYSGLFTRPSTFRDGQLYDGVSGMPMATQFSFTRFLVPHLCDDGWALFVDADVMVREDIIGLFRQADPSKAVMVVKHEPYVPRSAFKMDGQVQTSYPRKNWSSVVLWNCEHAANDRLTLHQINNAPGAWLHQFGWLKDEEIGSLDPKWNWLAGYSSPALAPGLVHFTDGIPAMPGYENEPYAGEWWDELRSWAAGAARQ
jgi:hypothetical protein